MKIDVPTKLGKAYLQMQAEGATAKLVIHFEKGNARRQSREYSDLLDEADDLKKA